MIIENEKFKLCTSEEKSEIIESFTTEIMQKKTQLIDIFPEKVPPKADNRYFDVEKFFQQNRSDVDRKFTDIILKIFCYYDMILVGQEIVNDSPTAKELIKLLDSFFNNDTAYINIILPEYDTLLTLSRDDLYITVYNACGKVEKLISKLSAAEGLFFYEAV